MSNIIFKPTFCLENDRICFCFSWGFEIQKCFLSCVQKTGKRKCVYGLAFVNSFGQHFKFKTIIINLNLYLVVCRSFIFNGFIIL